MVVEWTGPGPGLLLALDRASREPLGTQLQRALREAIRDGRLAPGERLPSSRGMAAELAVSRGLVVDTYAQLEAEGFVVSRVGSGTLVAASAGNARADAAGPAPVRRPRPDVDFEYGVPDLGRFPMRDWMWALGEAARRLPTAELGDEEGAGSVDLRRVVAAYLSRVRGAVAGADDVVVTSGFRQGLNVVLRALAAGGVTHVALEDPGPTEHDRIAARAGLIPVPVTVDDRGLDVDALAATPAQAVVVTPAHQCPTGVLLAPERRHALVAWAATTGGVVLEDDYDAEFRYDRQPVGSLQGLAPERVVAMGTVSKTLASGLRLGWMVVPPALRAAVLDEKTLTGRGAPALDQLALAALVESGRYDKHLRRMRSIYGDRRRVLVEALAADAPSLELTGLDAGCHGVLRLPAGVGETDVVDGAASRGVCVYGMSRYRSSRATEPGELVIGFGNVPEHLIRRGVRVLGEVVTGLGA